MCLHCEEGITSGADGSSGCEEGVQGVQKEAKQKYNLAIQQRDEALAQRDEARMQCGVIEFDVEFLCTHLRMAGYRIQELQEKQGKK